MNENVPASSQLKFDQAATAVFDYAGWRQTFLRTILIGACIFGLIALVPAFFSNSASLYIGIYSAAYAGLLLVTFINFPYQVKAGLFLLLIYAIGLSGILENGIWGDSRVYFLAFIVVSTLLFSPRAGIIATIISLLSLIIGGYLILTSQYQITGKDVSPGGADAWITGTTSVLLLAVVIVSGLALLQRGFDRARDLTLRTLNDLQIEQRTLEQHVEQRTDELAHRSEQLHSSTVIARQLAEIQDVPTLLSKAVDLISSSFGYYHVGIFLLDEERRTAFLQAASSEMGKQQLSRGFRVEEGSRSIVWQVAESARYQLITGAGRSTALIQDQDYQQTLSELALPLTVRGKVIGVLDIHSEHDQDFGAGDVETLETLGDQIAASLDNARLLSETQAILSQLETLTTQQTRTTWQEFTKQHKPAYQYTPSGVKPLSRGVSPKHKEGLQFPLQLRGQEIGTISLEKRTDSKWTEAEREFVEKITTQVSLALENSRLLEETRRRAAQEQTVSEISAHLNRSLDIEGLLQTAARELGSLPQISEVAVYIGGSDGSDHENNDK